MPLVERGQTIEPDPFITLTTEDTLPEAGAVIVPLARWQQERDALLERGAPVGVLLTGEDDPTELVEDLERIATIAVSFPKFADGRGYSIARLLRDRYGWTGTLRATGQILRDQLFYLHRCGFDTFALPEGRDAADTLKGLEDFSITYQTAADARPPVYLNTSS